MEELRLDSEPDTDCFEGKESETFPSPFHLSHSASVGLDQAYVLHLSASSDSKTVAAALSTGHVNLYKSDGLVKIANFQPHNAKITGIKFSHENPSVVYTSSLDETVKLWDLREDFSKPKTVFKDTSDQSKNKGPPMNCAKPLASFDISCDGKVVCAGTEQVGCDSYLLFWDSRSRAMMGAYWESHQDDITTVRFHPNRTDILATGSTDGQTNVFDISQQDEDEALTISHNTEDSVAQVQWFTRKNDPRFLAIMTHTEGIQLWDTEEGAPYKIFTRSEVAHGIRRSDPDYTYLVGLHTNTDQGLTVVAGSSHSTNPCLRLANIKNKKIKPLAVLRDKAVRSQVVRASIELGEGGGFVTGSEDGLVVFWSPGEKEGEENGVGGKEKTGKKKREKPY